MKYSIVPVEFKITGVETQMLTAIYMVITYQVGMTEMYVPYNLLTEEGQPLWNGSALISQAELDAWGEDDMYIVNLVATQAGVVLV